MKLDWPLGAMKCNTSDFKHGLEILNVGKIPNNCRITEMLRYSKVCKYFHELRKYFCQMLIFTVILYLPSASQGFCSEREV